MIISEMLLVKTKDYFIIELSAIVLLLLVIGIAKIISAKILGDAYKTVSDIESRILKEKPINDKDVLKHYRKITIFSDTAIMGAIILVYLFVCVPVYLSQGIRLVIFFIMLTIPLLPIAIIISLKRVRKYNKYFARSILVEGKITEGAKVNAIGRSAKIEVWYEFIDIYGREHKCRQMVNRFLFQLPYRKQIEKWEKLYYSGKRVNILVNAYETNMSYLPMREDYCKEYGKLYSLDLEQ
ncbi:MAG: hypothetical protein IJ661_10255 [Lachnospiraceae bacterium]|nr:hypothetical protein [Lachnospiraceae bacterium]